MWGSCIQDRNVSGRWILHRGCSARGNCSLWSDMAFLVPCQHCQSNVQCFSNVNDVFIVEYNTFANNYYLLFSGNVRETQFFLYEIGILVSATSSHFDFLFFHNISGSHEVLLQKIETSFDIFGFKLDEMETIALRNFILWIFLKFRNSTHVRVISVFIWNV